MTEKKRDHWSTLASLLGMGGKAAPPEEPVPEPSVVEVSPFDSLLGTLAPAPEEVAQSTQSLDAELMQISQEPPPAKRQDHWGSLLGQLGLPVPELPESAPVAAVENPKPTLSPRVPPTPKPARPASPPKPSAFSPNVQASASVESPAAPIVPVVSVSPMSNTPVDPLLAWERPKSAKSIEKKAMESRSRPEPTRTESARTTTSRSSSARAGGELARGHEARSDDEFAIDADLDSGLRELWADHERKSSAVAPKREAPRDIEQNMAEDAYAIGEEHEENLTEIRTSGGDGEGDDPNAPRRKRRRRRRGRRRGGAREGQAAGGISQEENAAVDDRFEDDVESDDEMEPDFEAQPEIKRPGSGNRRDESGDEAGDRPRRRRRRRTGRGADRTDAAVTAKVKSDEIDDFNDEDDPNALEYRDDSDKYHDSHTQIPTWHDAIGSIVSANMESRGRGGNPPPRGREGGRDQGTRDQGREGGREGGRGGRR